ncbi:unnamed protein product [Bursaphelenchus okinawaensis]|uniref:Uncharacterized protein n=1 Tax=Bursaphelenchus okinawaensis TaxID=465554 RepID=A0A811JVQ9_9BILA|nr:unnamed protein product [Bursaphelenchus okinawaensis]CAG9086000.1 unnamed protein product [Bursaphelenchus okinawaensis]
MADSAVVVEVTASEGSKSRKKQKEYTGIWEILEVQNIIHELTIIFLLLLVLCQTIFSSVFYCLSATTFVLPLLTLLGVLFYAFTVGKAALIYNLLVVFLLNVCTTFEAISIASRKDYCSTLSECVTMAGGNISLLISLLALITTVTLVVNILSNNKRGVPLSTLLVIFLVCTGVFLFAVVMLSINVDTRKLPLCDAQLLTLFGKTVTDMVYKHMGNQQ